MSEVDYSFLDDYFEEILSDPNFSKLHTDNELLAEEYEHIWNEEIANTVEQGFGISTFDYIKKVIQESLNDNDFETISKISKQLVKETERAGENNPADIRYWEFYENGCDLGAITCQGIYHRFLEYREEREGKE